MAPGEGTPAARNRGKPPRPPTARLYPEVVSRTRNPVQRALHLAMAVAGWALFAVTWYAIFARGLGPETVGTFLLLLFGLAGIVGVTQLWVAFNLSIYRRRGRRTQVREIQPRLKKDTLGRWIDAPPLSQLQHAPVIRIRVSPAGDRKSYEPLAPDDPTLFGQGGTSEEAGR